MTRSGATGKQLRRIAHTEISSNSLTSTTSATWVQVGSMTHTPNAGKYLFMFSATGKGSASAQQMEYGIEVDGTMKNHTRRRLDWNSGAQGNELWMTLHTQDIITTDGTKVIKLMYQTDSGTFSIRNRSLMILKLR